MVAFRKNIAVLESKKKYIEALSLVEKMIDTKLKQGKVKTLQIELGYRIRAANRQAAELLSKGKHKQAIELLSKAKSLTKKLQDNQEEMVLKSLIYNSIACVYREKLEVKLAQYYVEKAISLAKLADTTENLSIIYLNGASIYSQAKEHLQAKLYVENGIEMLNKEIIKVQATGDITKVNEKKGLLTFAYFTLGQQELKLNNNNKAYQNFILANRLAATSTEPLGTLKFKINQEIKSLQKTMKPKRILHIKNPTTKIATTLYSSISTRDLFSNKTTRRSIRPVNPAIHKGIYSNYNSLLSANYPGEQTLEETQKKFVAPNSPEDDIYPLMDRNKTAKISRKRIKGSTSKIRPFDSLRFKDERVFDNIKFKYKQETFDNRLAKDKDSNEETKELNGLLWSDYNSESNSITGNMLNSDKYQDVDISPLNKDTNWITIENFGAINGESALIQKESAHNESTIKTTIAPTLKRKKGIKIFNSQANLEKRKYKVIKIHSQYEKHNTYENKKGEDEQMKLDTHPKISLKLKTKELINEIPETSLNIVPMDLNNEEQLNATAMLKLEEKSGTMKSSRGKRISHFISLTNIHTFKENDLLQDNYDTEKEKLTQLMEKATKIQATYKSYKEQVQYKQQKERQFSNRRVLVYRGFYSLAKNDSLRTIISIYIVQRTDVELIFTDFKTNDIAYRWKGKCDCPLSAEMIKLCWEEIINEGEGNSGNDCKELVKRIQSMKYKDIVFHVEEQEGFCNHISNVEIRNENDNVQQEDLLVSAIKKTNNSINKVLTGNISIMDSKKRKPSMVEEKQEALGESKMEASSLIDRKRRYSIVPENNPLITEMKQPTVTKEAVQALEIKSNLEEYKTKLTSIALSVPEEKKESVLINPNFQLQHLNTTLANHRRRSVINDKIDLAKSEATNSLFSVFSKKSILKKKQFASASISMGSIKEIPTMYDEMAAAVRTQRWYRAILLWDRINFNPKNIYEVIARRNLKLPVEYKDCSGDQKEINIRLLYVRKKETENIELIAINKKTNKRYKAIFMLHKEVAIKELKNLNDQVSILVI